MKKLISCIIAIMLLVSCAYAEEAMPKTRVFMLSAGKPIDLSDETFSDGIIIIADPTADAENRGIINIINCVIDCGVTIIGDCGTTVTVYSSKLTENTVFDVLATDMDYALNAVLEDDFLRVIIMECEGNAVVNANGLCNSVSDTDITLNGVTYSMADYPDNDVQICAHYYENGAPQVFRMGENE